MISAVQPFRKVADPKKSHGRFLLRLLPMETNHLALSILKFTLITLKKFFSIFREQNKGY